MNIQLTDDNLKENVGKCKVNTNRFANGKVFCSIEDFIIDTESVEKMSESLETFKKMNTNLLNYESSVNKE